MQAHKEYSRPNTSTSIHLTDSKYGLALRLLFCVVITSGVWAQTAEDQSASEPSEFPYTAQVVGDDVNIRSGPGTNYYECGRVNTGDTVEVIGHQAGWLQIVPPAGSFSWVAMQYISINADAPTTGIVTGEGVVVYAGSDYVLPMHSTTKQVMLNRGDKIKLLSEEMDEYYKIAPPQGS